MRQLAWAALVAGSTVFSGAAASQSTTNVDIRAAPEPVHETVFGIAIDDPYRWMESDDRAADVADFIGRSGEHMAAVLAAMPGRARLRERTAAAFAAGTQYGDAQLAGGRLFYLRTDAGARFAKLVVRDRDGGERVLYDPEGDGVPGGAVNNYRVSPDGSLVAFHTAGGGAEVGAIGIIDTPTGRLLPDRIAPVWGQMTPDWIDERRLAVTRMSGTEGGDPLLDMQALIVRVGGGEDRTGTVLLGSKAADSPFEPREIPMIVGSPASAWLVGLGVGARADQRILVARRGDVLAGRRPGWREIAAYADQVNAVAGPIGGQLYLLSSKGASNRQVLRIDLDKTQRLDAAEVMVAAGDAMLTDIAAARDGLYVAWQRDGLSGLDFYPRDGRGPVHVDLPLRGSLGQLEAAADGAGIGFMMQDWLTAPRWFRADGGRVAPLGLDGTSYAPAREWTQLTEQAVSADGTRVPMAVLLPRDARQGTPLPLLLQGYGAYGVSYTEPRYVQQHFGFIEEGGAVAFCGTRGGGERGRAWHEAGRGEGKANAHADLIACGERLVELGLTAPGRMTVLGGSAGGLLAPPAALKRPDLFRSLVAAVAILNPTRIAVAPNGPNQFAEMGDPGREEGFRGLLAADAYQMLADAKDMPDTLLVVGLNDNRVAPWFSAKYAARARDRFGDRRLMLIRTDSKAGHGIGSASDVTIDTYTDIGAFVFDRAGVAGFAGR